MNSAKKVSGWILAALLVALAIFPDWLGGEYFRISVLLAAFGIANQGRAADVDLASLSWLEGLWAGSKDGVEMEERWSSTQGGALLGTHKDVKDGRMVSYEFFRIDSTQDGAFYFASPRARRS